VDGSAPSETKEEGAYRVSQDVEAQETLRSFASTDRKVDGGPTGTLSGSRRTKPRGRKARLITDVTSTALVMCMSTIDRVGLVTRFIDHSYTKLVTTLYRSLSHTHRLLSSLH
jgi:hypothetical protein